MCASAACNSISLTNVCFAGLARLGEVYSRGSRVGYPVGYFLTRAGWREPALLLVAGSAPCAPNTAAPGSSAPSGCVRRRLARPRKSSRPAPATRPAAVFYLCGAAGAVWVLGLFVWRPVLLEWVLRRPGLARLPRGPGHSDLTDPSSTMPMTSTGSSPRRCQHPNGITTPMKSVA